MFVLSADTPKYPASARNYLRKPPSLKPSDCTPLFLAAFERGAVCCIHTHSQWCVLITLLVEKLHGKDACFEISNIEQIKGIPKGRGKAGRLGFHDTLSVPIIENTAFEEDLTEALEAAMEKYPDTYAVLVRRHGMYVMRLEYSECYRLTLTDTSGVTMLPKRRHSARAWTTSSSLLSVCMSWACHGHKRDDFMGRNRLYIRSRFGFLSIMKIECSKSVTKMHSELEGEKTPPTRQGSRSNQVKLLPMSHPPFVTASKLYLYLR